MPAQQGKTAKRFEPVPRPKQPPDRPPEARHEEQARPAQEPELPFPNWVRYAGPPEPERPEGYETWTKFVDPNDPEVKPGPAEESEPEADFERDKTPPAERPASASSAGAKPDASAKAEKPAPSPEATAEASAGASSASSAGPAVPDTSAETRTPGDTEIPEAKQYGKVTIRPRPKPIAGQQSPASAFGTTPPWVAARSRTPPRKIFKWFKCDEQYNRLEEVPGPERSRIRNPPDLPELRPREAPVEVSDLEDRPSREVRQAKRHRGHRKRKRTAEAVERRAKRGQDRRLAYEAAAKGASQPPAEISDCSSSEESSSHVPKRSLRPDLITEKSDTEESVVISESEKEKESEGDFESAAEEEAPAEEASTASASASGIAVVPAAITAACPAPATPDLPDFSEEEKEKEKQATGATVPEETK